MKEHKLQTDFDKRSGHVAVNRVRSFLEGFYISPPAEDISSGVWELVRNVNEWAGSDGYLTAFTERDKLTIVVNDTGVGVYHHLQVLPGVLSPTQAARQAFESGVTSSGDMLRGRGLPYCLSLTESGGKILLDTIGATVSGWRGQIQTVSRNTREGGTSVLLQFHVARL